MFGWRGRDKPVRRQEETHHSDQGAGMKRADMNSDAHHVAARVLAALLNYPGAELRAALPDLRVALQSSERALSDESREAVVALIDTLQDPDALEAEARYVDTFDRGRRTSL